MSTFQAIPNSFENFFFLFQASLLFLHFGLPFLDFLAIILKVTLGLLFRSFILFNKYFS